MYDITFLIPDYEEADDMPLCPDDEIPEREKERLAMDLYYQVDNRALDPNNDVL